VPVVDGEWRIPRTLLEDKHTVQIDAVVVEGLALEVLERPDTLFTASSGVPHEIRVVRPCEASVLVNGGPEEAPVLADVFFSAGRTKLEAPLNPPDHVTPCPSRLEARRTAFTWTPTTGTLWFTAQGFGWGVLDSRQLLEQGGQATVRIPRAGSLRAILIGLSEFDASRHLRLELYRRDRQGALTLTHWSPKPDIVEEVAGLGGDVVEVTFEALPAGPYRVSVSATTEGSQAVEVASYVGELRDGEQEQVELALEPSKLVLASLEGSVIFEPTAMEPPSRLTLLRSTTTRQSFASQEVVELSSAETGSSRYGPVESVPGTHWLCVDGVAIERVELVAGENFASVDLRDTRTIHVGFIDQLTGESVTPEKVYSLGTSKDIGAAEIGPWQASASLHRVAGRLTVPIRFSGDRLLIYAVGPTVRHQGVIDAGDQTSLVEVDVHAALRVQLVENGTVKEMPAGSANCVQVLDESEQPVVPAGRSTRGGTLMLTLPVGSEEANFTVFAAGAPFEKPHREAVVVRRGQVTEVSLSSGDADSEPPHAEGSGD
jgi:hypothetical protein